MAIPHQWSTQLGGQEVFWQILCWGHRSYKWVFELIQIIKVWQVYRKKLSLFKLIQNIVDIIRWKLFLILLRSLKVRLLYQMKQHLLTLPISTLTVPRTCYIFELKHYSVHDCFDASHLCFYPLTLEIRASCTWLHFQSLSKGMWSASVFIFMTPIEYNYASCETELFLGQLQNGSM